MGSTEIDSRGRRCRRYRRPHRQRYRLASDTAVICYLLSSVTCSQLTICYLYVCRHPDMEVTISYGDETNSETDPLLPLREVTYDIKSTTGIKLNQHVVPMLSAASEPGRSKLYHASETPFIHAALKAISDKFRCRCNIWHRLPLLYSDSCCCVWIWQEGVPRLHSSRRAQAYPEASMAASLGDSLDNCDDHSHTVYMLRDSNDVMLVSPRRKQRSRGARNDVPMDMG